MGIFFADVRFREVSKAMEEVEVFVGRVGGGVREER